MMNPTTTEENDDSNHHESDIESSGSSISSSSSSSEIREEASFDYDEDSFSSSSYANDSEDESSYSSSSQHSRDSSTYSDERNDNCSNDGDSIVQNDADRNGNDKVDKNEMNPQSSLFATTNFTHAASSAPSKLIATNRTFQRGVIPIAVSTNGYGGFQSNNTLTQRRGKKPLESTVSHPPQCRQSENNKQVQNENDSSKDSNRRHHRKRSSRRHHKKSKPQQQHGILKCCINFIRCESTKRSTNILILAFSLWLMAQFYYFFYHDVTRHLSMAANDLYNAFFGPTGGENDPYYSGTGYIDNEYFHDYSNRYTQKKSSEDMMRLRKQRAKEAREALGSAAMSSDKGDDDFEGGGRKRRKNRNSNRSGRKRKKSRDEEGFTKKERLSEGCSALEWHSYHFPNCNDIHDIDLGAVVRNPRENYRRKMAATSDEVNETTSESFPWGFVSNGLWRDVFSCDPRGEVTNSIESSFSAMPPAVLKIMKREHDYDVRNFQRHRRDALVMERLSSSHHLVPIYGYCANTVLTQAISHTLDDVIYARENEMKKKWNPRNGYQTKPPLESWMGKDENGELLATRETELGRINLALGVFRGLADLHEGDGTTDMDWLPVIHADLQAKQYLVDSDTGKVYLNDFNRCRFMGKKNVNSTYAIDVTLEANNADHETASIQSCPIHIPTAPGYARSPEEYNSAPLTEKLDVYSAGNILYGIITGNKPFNGERGKHIKQDIQNGKPPEVDPSIRDQKGTVDAELAGILDRVYEVDPDKRASAKEIVVALEILLQDALSKGNVVKENRAKK